ncbi:MAG: peptidylprolyl isomerase [Oligoflexia bacterium]|nr:peptidylprolyl isomerase [Oligoflexia bacterium]
MRVLLLTAVLGIFTAVPSLYAAPELVDYIVAVIGDNIKTDSDLNKFRDFVKVRKDGISPDEYQGLLASRRKLLDKLVEETLVLQYAEENDLAISEEEINELITRRMNELGMTRSQFERQLRLSGQNMEQFRQSIRVDRAKARLFESELKTRIASSEDDLKRYFENKTGEKVNIIEYRIQHILLNNEAEAEKVKARLLAGGDFGELAYKYSVDKGTASTKGDLGFLQESELLPQLRQRIVNMSPGDIKGPVRTKLGYHIIKLAELRNRENPNYVSARADIERMFVNKEFEKQLTLWTERRKDDFYVKIYL